MTVKKRSTGTQKAADAGHWLALAAAPTFALMAWVSVVHAPHAVMCSSSPGFLSLDGMGWMYVLMTLFHAPPWLKLASGPVRRSPTPVARTKGT